MERLCWSEFLPQAWQDWPCSPPAAAAPSPPIIGARPCPGLDLSTARRPIKPRPRVLEPLAQPHVPEAAAYAPGREGRIHLHRRIAGRRAGRQGGGADPVGEGVEQVVGPDADRGPGPDIAG